VDILGGDTITKPQKMLEILAEGGSGYHIYGHCAERVVITPKKDSNQ